MQGLSAVTGGLAIHRSEHRNFGGGPVDTQLGGYLLVKVVVERGQSQSLVAGNGGQHPRLDLTEVGAYEHVPWLGHDRRPQVGGHAVKPSRSSHPARRTVGAGPYPPEPPVGTEMVVEPGVPVGGRHPLGFPPGQQGTHNRVSVLDGSKPLGPGVDYLDAEPGEQRLDLDVTAHVDLHAFGQMAQYLAIALRA